MSDEEEGNRASKKKKRGGPKRKAGRGSGLTLVDAVQDLYHRCADHVRDNWDPKSLQHMLCLAVQLHSAKCDVESLGLADSNRDDLFNLSEVEVCYQLAVNSTRREWCEATLDWLFNRDTLQIRISESYAELPIIRILDDKTSHGGTFANSIRLLRHHNSGQDRAELQQYLADLYVGYSRSIQGLVEDGYIIFSLNQLVNRKLAQNGSAQRATNRDEPFVQSAARQAANRHIASTALLATAEKVRVARLRIAALRQELSMWEQVVAEWQEQLNQAEIDPGLNRESNNQDYDVDYEFMDE
jgi:hypothetical protein